MGFNSAFKRLIRALSVIETGLEFEMLSVLVSDISVNVSRVRRPTDI